MDFRLDDEQLALQDAAGALCDRHFDLGDIASRETRPVTDQAWSALSDMGLFALLNPNEPGGAVEAAIVVEQLGTHVASGPYRWTALAASLPVAFPEVTQRVAGVEVGSGSAPPHVIEHSTESDTIVVVYDNRVERFATTALLNGVGDAHAGTLGAPAFDPLTPASAHRSLPLGESIGGADDVQRLRTVGAVLAAAELVGNAQGALDVACSYAKERHQFGVPIGSFQAIKHILADMFVRVELARSAAYAAAAMYDDERAGDAVTAASTAKLLAGDAGIANAKAAVQVLGGMGFTWEMLPHYFLKRAWLLEHSFGNSETHALALSSALDDEVRKGTRAWT